MKTFAALLGLCVIWTLAVWTIASPILQTAATLGEW